MSENSAPRRSVSFDRTEARRLLGDEAWLRREYQLGGDNAIAAHLGVSSETVRRARHKLKIVSRPRGGQLGTRGGSSTRHRKPRERGIVQIAARTLSESGPDGPAPTANLVIARTRALIEAELAGDRLAAHDALIAIGSAASLVIDQRQAVEAS